MILNLLASFALLRRVSSLPAVGSDDQVPLGAVAHHDASPAPRELTGNFLHISDLHPDPFYLSGASTSEACHRSSGSAGPLGAEKTDCDSPISLINATFDWLDQNLANDIDFIVWTGDSARHDNDERIPRNKSQVLGLNRFLVQKFGEVWGADGKAGQRGEFKIPIIPTFGNNDILPHNILFSGPNQWTKEYLQIWRRMIPEEQRHSFARGGWYYVEVMPNRLAVFSLNTMYFFANNAAVDGCDDKSEPGFEQFEWLRVQLELLRQRGVKAILSGHVPPARNDDKEQWTESCWMKYALWMQQYRDVVIGSLWGHMNVEHFFLQDFNDIIWDTATNDLLQDDDVDDQAARDSRKEHETREASPELHRRDDSLTALVKTPSYLNALREQWSALPLSPPPAGKDPQSSKKGKKPRKSPEDRYHDAIGGQHGERYAVSFVSASVVPNFYPTLRVFKYNATGLENAHVGTAQDMASSFLPHNDAEAHKFDLTATADMDSVNWNDLEAAMQLAELHEFSSPKSQSRKTNRKQYRKNKKKKKHGKKRKPHFVIPSPPSATAAPGPAYSQQSLSWLGYVQYFANLTHIQRTDENVAEGDKLREFKYEVEYNTTDPQDVYNLSPQEGGEHSGITVRNMLDLASRIGSYKPGKNNLLEDDVPDESDEELNEEKKKKKKKGKKHRKHKKKKRRKIVNKTWYAFVDRALVGTVPKDELHRDYGQPED